MKSHSVFAGSRMNQQGSEYYLQGQVASSNNNDLSSYNHPQQHQQQHQQLPVETQYPNSQNSLSLPPNHLSPHSPSFQAQSNPVSPPAKPSKSSKPKFWNALKMKSSSPFRSKSSDKSPHHDSGSSKSSKNSSTKLHQSAARLLEATFGSSRSPKSASSAPPSTNLKDQRNTLFKDSKTPSKLSLVNLLKRKSSNDKSKVDKKRNLPQSANFLDPRLLPADGPVVAGANRTAERFSDDEEDFDDDEDDDDDDFDDNNKTIEDLTTEHSASFRLNITKGDGGGGEEEEEEEEEDGEYQLDDIHNELDDSSRHEETMTPNINDDRMSKSEEGEQAIKKNLSLGDDKSKSNFRSLESQDSVFETCHDLQGHTATLSANVCEGRRGEHKRSYVLEVELKEGKDLLIKDRCGTSDPYVKFKLNRKVVYKSCTIEKDLNPVWNECFLIPLKDLQEPILAQVYDYDLGPKMDDFMGQAFIQPSLLALSQPVELNLMLETKKGSKKFSYMGYVKVKCTLLHLDDVQLAETKAKVEAMTMRAQKTSTNSEKIKKNVMKRFKNEPLGNLNVLLIEGIDLIAMDDNGLSDPYVKFQLGQEKVKSKCKVKTLNPRWLESFDFDWWSFDQSELEISVFDHDVGGRDDILGRAKLDIRDHELNKSNHIKVDLEDGAGQLVLLLTLCPYQHPNIHSQNPPQQAPLLLQQLKQLPEEARTRYEPLLKNLSSCSALDDSDLKKEIASLNLEYADKYNIMNTMNHKKDLGKLILTIHQAKDLVAADLGGKSDPFCVVELVNCRLQTNTVYKSLYPRWRNTYVIDVCDIHTALEVTVFDYDKSKRSEFLGKVVIPLLRIKNCMKKWYLLKDKKLTQPTRGAIELEISLHYNPIKAVLRTFNPREEKLLVPEKAFKLGTLKGNTDRVFKLLEGMVQISNFVNGCFDWKEKIHGTIAFVTFVVIVWNAELYMVPIALILLLLKNLIVLNYNGRLREDETPQEYIDQDRKEGDTYKKSKDEKKGQSLRERLQSIQDVCLQVQETMDAVACLGERVKNTFLWKTPWLSMLAILSMLTISTIIYLVPLRFIVLAWGVMRFTRRMRVGDRIPNNEVLDFLSRVPSDIELVEYRELK